MNITTEERVLINQALAKAIAYKNCGKEEDAVTRSESMGIAARVARSITGKIN